MNTYEDEREEIPVTTKANLDTPGAMESRVVVIVVIIMANKSASTFELSFMI